MTILGIGLVKLSYRISDVSCKFFSHSDKHIPGIFGSRENHGKHYDRNRRDLRGNVFFADCGGGQTSIYHAYFPIDRHNANVSDCNMQHCGRNAKSWSHLGYSHIPKYMPADGLASAQNQSLSSHNRQKSYPPSTNDTHWGQI